MRVQLTARRRSRSEAGTIALLAALLSTTLLLLAAFTLDFGLAYTSKQRLQEAVDAGALAAVQVYKGHAGACAVLAADPLLKAQAQQAADKWAAQNREATVGSAVSVTCSPAGLTVTYSASGTTPVGLGQLAGIDSEISIARTAAATIGRQINGIGGLRPWGICSGVATTSGTVTFVPMKKGSTSTQDAVDLCGADAPPGGWWVMQCTDQSNGNGATGEAVRDGCETAGYHPVPGQPGSGPAALLPFLKDACPSKTTNDMCLSSDPGNNFPNSTDEWQTLVDQTFTMPVMCSIPTCTHLAVTGSGNNASYAIQQMATVQLCGFKMEPKSASTGWPTTGPCATANPRGYKSTDVTNGAGFFLVIKGLTGSPTGDWTLEEYTALRLTK